MEQTIDPTRSDFVRKILIVDDEPIIRGLMAHALSTGDTLCKTAASAAEAMQIAKGFDPDVAIVDLDLGSGTGGVGLIVALQASFPWIATILMSNFLPTGQKASQLRQSVYLPKSEVENVEAVLAAIDEATKLGPEKSQRKRVEIASDLKLTTNQTRIMRLMLQGYSNSEIASELGLALRSVEATIGRIYKRLNLEERPPGVRRIQATTWFANTYGRSGEPIE